MQRQQTPQLHHNNGCPPNNRISLNNISFYRQNLIGDLQYFERLQKVKMKGGSEHHGNNMKRFVGILAMIQLIIIIIYGIFVRIQSPQKIGATLNSDKYSPYQDVNVMMLIGFGYAMAFSKSFSWSAVSYTFFINALLLQLFILFNAFWRRVLIQGFSHHNYYIYITQETFTQALFSSSTMLIAFGAVLGRVGPLEALIMCIVHEVGYTLNNLLVLEVIGAFDVGASMTMHAFGAYSGIAMSLILSQSVKPQTVKPIKSYISTLFAFLGTLFLWMYWPSINFGVAANTPFAKTQVIVHTVLALTASCLSAFLSSAYLTGKFTMSHLLNASLAGGVGVGSISGLIYYPGVSMGIGCLMGICTTLCFHYLSPYLEKKFQIFDTCGVHNLHGIPGILGGIFSAMTAASFNSPYLAIDEYPLSSYDFPPYERLISQPFKQGGLQMAGTFTSVGIAICTGILTGVIMKIYYSFDEKEFYRDDIYFNEAMELLQDTSPSQTLQFQTSPIKISNVISQTAIEDNPQHKKSGDELSIQPSV